ncbi:hypothetical protein DFH28DRAFT_1125265 [Melampsora americana]|nr:hypothetical protein DFH28DRAFT_1125265 [Melampsora americana]
MSDSSSSATRKLEKIVIPVATDERCWFKCKQSNAGRVRGSDPKCRMLCYYSNKIPSLPINPPEELISSLQANPANTSTPQSQQTISPSTSNQTITDELEEKRAKLIERYTIPALRGSFIYFAIGKPAVSRHLASMRRLHSVEHNWIYEKLKEESDDQSEWETVPKRPVEQTNRGLMVLSYHRDYEKTINISYSLASIITSIHLHFERLYKPTYQILSKLPTSISNLSQPPSPNDHPSQFALLIRLYNKPILSDSIQLINRSVESVTEVMNRLVVKYQSKLEDQKRDPPNRGNPPASRS